MKNYLEANFNPIECGLLEKFGRFEGAEEIALALGLGWPVFQRVEHVVFQQLLVGDAHFDGLSRWTMFPVPALDQRHIKGTSRESRTQIEWTRGPQ